MQEFTLRFSQTYKLVLAMVLPCLLIIPFIYLLATYGPDLSETAALIVIFGLLVFIFAIVFLLIKWCIPKVSILLNSHGMQVRFISSSPLNPADFIVPATDLARVAASNTEGGPYISFRTIVKPHRFNLAAITSKEEDAGELVRFAERLVEIVLEMEEEKKK